MINREEKIKASTILRCEVGSTAHGISIGNDDRDEMGVCVEPIEFVAGLSNFEQLVYRSAIERTGEHNAKSEPGDLDLVIYSLRKYVRLALKGNPTVLTLLFAPTLLCTPEGQELRDLAPLIVSKHAGRACLGYLQAQRQRLLGERGGAHGRLQQRENKYAAHMVRLGIQGAELMQTGRISVPMKEDQAEFVRQIRTGFVSQQHALTVAGEFERELKDLTDIGPLREAPCSDTVEAWLVETYRESWTNL